MWIRIFLCILWEGLQWLIGLILIPIFKCIYWNSSEFILVRGFRVKVEGQVRTKAFLPVLMMVVESKDRHIWAFSLGKVIFTEKIDFDMDTAKGQADFTKWFSIIRHEYGHSVQSVMLGPFYLLVVGVPSFLLTGINSKTENLYMEKWANKIMKDVVIEEVDIYGQIIKNEENELKQ